MNMGREGEWEVRDKAKAAGLLCRVGRDVMGIAGQYAREKSLVLAMLSFRW